MLVCWSSFPCAGVNRLSDNLKEMTGSRANIFFVVCWLIIAPLLITVSQQAFFISMIQTKSVTATLKIVSSCFAGYPDFLHHPVQTSPLRWLRLPSLGSGGRLGHCHGFHHLDSFGCHPHFVVAPWLINAGDELLPFFQQKTLQVVHVGMCRHAMFIQTQAVC